MALYCDGKLAAEARQNDIKIAAGFVPENTIYFRSVPETDKTSKINSSIGVRLDNLDATIAAGKLDQAMNPVRRNWGEAIIIDINFAGYPDSCKVVETIKFAGEIVPRAELALKVRKSVDKAVRLCRGVYTVLVTNPATEPLTNSRPMDDAEPFNGSIPFTGLDALVTGDLYLNLFSHLEELPLSVFQELPLSDVQMAFMALSRPISLAVTQASRRSGYVSFSAQVRYQRRPDSSSLIPSNLLKLDRLEPSKLADYENRDTYETVH
ncbi:hypothetical protein IEO21_08554 [Rhodonia placenta]|uniref:Uncharacterized protein n=1 Tax=Rhodonia placenta TaxID=104341 RepID=A0A8H7NW81_9APHY|nr:hypothetical protein IEO21_08554 [Postia placenta]